MPAECIKAAAPLQPRSFREAPLQTGGPRCGTPRSSARTAGLEEPDLTAKRLFASRAFAAGLSAAGARAFLRFPSLGTGALLSPHARGVPGTDRNRFFAQLPLG